MTRNDLLSHNNIVYKQGQFVVVITDAYYKVFCQVNDHDYFEKLREIDTTKFTFKYNDGPPGHTDRQRRRTTEDSTIAPTVVYSRTLYGNSGPYQGTEAGSCFRAETEPTQLA